jgi:hypothetical protein
MNRREFVISSAALALARRTGFAFPGGRIDRAALVRRHNPVLTKMDPSSPLQVGNGEFAFACDITGLQTFAEPYEHAMPLGTQSQWGWHSFPNSHNYQLEDVLSPYDSHGRKVPYPDAHGSEAFTDRSKPPDPLQDAATWLYSNPHRMHLGRIGLALRRADGGDAVMGDLTSSRQELDLWTGTIVSEFQFDGKPVRVTTICHPQRALVAIRVESPLVATKRVGISLAFPYASADFRKTVDWTSPDRHQTNATRTEGGADFERVLDATRYWVQVAWRPGSSLATAAPHHFEIVAPDRNELELVIEFSPTPTVDPMPGVTAIQSASSDHWQHFWSDGGAIDLSGCTDPRAKELERRIVLSQYLTAVNCAGSLPPQETGLVTNSWCGKFHLEMHWWHAAHFVPWGRAELLERSFPWYSSILPRARETARRQGYRGARWPKQVGPDGREAPSNIGVFLVWQQPHPIYYAELLYRARPTGSTLEQYREIVQETAEFMASYAWWDAAANRYVLGPPLIPAQEGYWPDRERIINPTFELAYWQWALSVAQKWRERLGEKRDADWDKVMARLSVPTARDGVYAAIEVEPYTQRTDHPSILMALGFVPATPLIDAETMRRTLHSVLAQWDWRSTWGWDYPVLAMTAARLGEPEKAVDALLMDAPKNHYLPNGHNVQVPGFLPLYLPGNGGLLYATAMMAAGWEGAPSVPAPGFPANGRWQIQYEGLQAVL